MKTRLAVMVFLLSALPVCANQLTVTKYDFVVVRQGRNAQGPVQTTLTKTLYVAADGRQLRDEPDPETNHHAIYLDLPDGTHHILDANAKTFFTVTDSRMLAAATHKAPSLGTKTIQGLSCNGYASNTLVNIGGEKHSETWWCVDAASGQKFIGDRLEQFSTAGVGLREHIQKVTTGVQVPDTFFDVPSDYQFDNTRNPLK
jgi:hypothetical protein